MYGEHLATMRNYGPAPSTKMNMEEVRKAHFSALALHYPVLSLLYVTPASTGSLESKFRRVKFNLEHCVNTSLNSS